ncbi:hypothetical protein OK349_15465 [Sphingomonas sp. BT-65]|uniref:hypothetical protein n=1 Tax=Sphingomonas sp. BT-65 TaxID=2989821 RepID=UPI002235A3A1|nr:hypothetical protein [Sphingomonas sp. BT-65]MCW4463112.1 hypothetical protein [Sphingomonas sp. BT-65]
MALGDIKAALGIDRVIWIDDVFGDPVVDLAILARAHPNIQDEFPELRAAFQIEGFGDVDAELAQAIRDLGDDRRTALREVLLQQDAEQAPTQELSADVIEEACGHLGVAKEDRWAFQEGDAQLAQNNGDDASVAYVIDLKEGGGPGQRGLDMLAQLRAANSAGVAFILTHEAAIGGEAVLETQLADAIAGAAGAQVALPQPLTVISKGRLTADGANIEGALSIALKRAGLRRTLHRVLTAASSRASEAYKATAASLLTVEPERLEQFVYERGRVEGVSELSVVERALSAGASKDLRTFFASNAIVLAGMSALRALQSIPLDTRAQDAGPILADLRNSEVWDGSEVINAAFTPLANGDVFCFDNKDPSSPNSPRLFVLLGQPCDIMLRPDGRRVSDVAMLVPLIEQGDDGLPVPDPNDPHEDDSDKSPELPFRFQSKKFKLDLRRLAYVRLDVLDLACLRPDGCVRVEAGHSPPSGLLAGGKSIYERRTSAADSCLAAPVPIAAAPGQRMPIDDRLLLTMSSNAPWERVRMGVRMEAYVPPPGHHLQALPDRVTWFLRREGRIRAPYSAFLLERALRTLGRRAFDSDYTI